jgi:hypothetical protein
LEQLELTLCHSLNDEPAIVGEEEKAPTTSGAFTCLKYLIVVKHWMQRLFKNFRGQVGAFVNFLEVLP